MSRFATRDEHLFGAGPKRILTLDGGGVRGILSLAILKRIEDLLREREGGGDPAFRLSDYFDLIGGTSTGAIIAVGLALGLSVDELVALYETMTQSVFRPRAAVKRLFQAKFTERALETVLRERLGDRTLGSDELRTGLAIVTKRLDTGSAWLLTNNPRAPYYEWRPELGEDYFPNKDLPLYQLVRASTAAPTYFKPERLAVGPGQVGAFVDGAVSPYNNPALLLLVMATLQDSGLGWPLGEERLLLVSVGAGTHRFHATPESLEGHWAMLGLASLRSVLSDADWHSQALLQWLSSSPTRWSINREIRTARSTWPGPHLCTYLRYDVFVDRAWLARELEETLGEDELALLAAMDNPAAMELARRLGTKAGWLQVQPGHFPATFSPAAAGG